MPVRTFSKVAAAGFAGVLLSLGLLLVAPSARAQAAPGDAPVFASTSLSATAGIPVSITVDEDTSGGAIDQSYSGGDDTLKITTVSEPTIASPASATTVAVDG